VQCPVNQVAIAGGGRATDENSLVEGDDLQATFPLVGNNPAAAGQVPTGWRATVDLATSGVTVWAICVNR
jgi:hypothetical protein